MSGDAPVRREGQKFFAELPKGYEGAQLRQFQGDVFVAKEGKPPLLLKPDGRIVKLNPIAKQEKCAWRKSRSR